MPMRQPETGAGGRAGRVRSQGRAGHGRELFAVMRRQVGSAEQGACSLFVDEDVLDNLGNAA